LANRTVTAGEYEQLLSYIECLLWQALG
jgi:hypothetical protein